MFVSGKFARQLVVFTVVISKKSCLSQSGQHLLEYVGDMSRRLDAVFRRRTQVACVLQKFLGCGKFSKQFEEQIQMVQSSHQTIWCKC